jgi:hypothetical protein
MAEITPLTPRPPARDYGDPATVHLRHQPMGVCTDCGVGSSAAQLIYTDEVGDDWHVDCYVRVKRTAPPRHWKLGRRVLPFTR